MRIDHVQFYVDDAEASRDWFVHYLGLQPIASGANHHTRIEVVGTHSGKLLQGQCQRQCQFVLSSPLTSLSPTAQFLSQHPAGVADIAFLVEDVEAVMERATASGAKVLQPLQEYRHHQGCLRWGKIAAWGSLSHTLIERDDVTSLLPVYADVDWEVKFFVDNDSSDTTQCSDDRTKFTGIDHVVLNVAAGDLERTVTWYKNTLDFQSKQTFKIQTERSALRSQVMVSRNSWVQFAINEPASPNSQIQEFLNVNRGAGIQHIALQTSNLVEVIAQCRRIGLPLLPVPLSYYSQLQQRQGFSLSAAQFEEIAQQQILVDWEDTAVGTVQASPLLLQTFTQPIFGQPTFFFELIERRSQARGFGEGNFRALFEAVEREQLKRGSLK